MEGNVGDKCETSLEGGEGHPLLSPLPSTTLAPPRSRSTNQTHRRFCVPLARHEQRQEGLQKLERKEKLHRKRGDGDECVLKDKPCELGGLRRSDGGAHGATKRAPKYHDLLRVDISARPEVCQRSCRVEGEPGFGGSALRATVAAVVQRHDVDSKLREKRVQERQPHPNITRVAVQVEDRRRSFTHLLRLQNEPRVAAHPVGRIYRNVLVFHPIELRRSVGRRHLLWVFWHPRRVCCVQHILLFQVQHPDERDPEVHEQLPRAAPHEERREEHAVHHVLLHRMHRLTLRCRRPHGPRYTAEERRECGSGLRHASAHRASERASERRLRDDDVLGVARH